MCDQESQCFSPSLAKPKERCPNGIVCGSRFHCEAHSGPARKLYLEYKLACTEAENCDLNRVFPPTETSKEIIYFNECYKSFIKAYDGRMKHRKYAFHPQAWDEGHQKQFRLLKTRIDLCEKRLDLLYARQKAEFEVREQEKEKEQKVIMKEQEPESPSSKESKESKVSFPAPSSFRNVEKFRRRRAADNAEVDRLLKKYIKQNQVLSAERQKMFTLAYNTLRSFLPFQQEEDSSSDDDDEGKQPKLLTDGHATADGTAIEDGNTKAAAIFVGDGSTKAGAISVGDGSTIAKESSRSQTRNSEDDYDSDEEKEERNLLEYLQVVGVYRIVKKLNEIGYLTPYEYEPLRCTGCNCGRFVADYFKLGCRCIFGYASLNSYLKTMKVSSMKVMINLLLKYRDRIEPVVNDYFEALDEDGPEVLIRKSQFAWSAEMQRLEFKEDFDTCERLSSKMMARSRKRGFVTKMKSERATAKAAAAIRSKSTALVLAPSHDSKASK